jgi:hypothetical protein
MDGRPRFQEGSLQISLMVLLSVVVRHGPHLILWAQLADIGQTACNGYLAYPFQKRAIMMTQPVLFQSNHASDRW